MRRLLLVALALLPSAAFGADFNVGPDDYRATLGMLQPGDRMIMAAGTYLRGLPLADLEGAPGAPIVIEGPSSGPPAVITGRACCNTISLRNVAYIEIRNLELDLQGEFVDGVKAETSAFAHHITLEGLYIHGFPSQQQAVGISTKCPAWDWVIRGNSS